jgi:hypothetical protein
MLNGIIVTSIISKVSQQAKLQINWDLLAVLELGGMGLGRKAACCHGHVHWAIGPDRV